jgi:4-hydroxybenzoate polyprenyltransferase
MGYRNAANVGAVPLGIDLARALGNCVLEARPVVQVIFLMRFFAGILLANGHPGTAATPLVLGALSWWCATVFIYLLNGVMDVVEDRVNGSRRPVAAGALPQELATGACIGFAVVATLLAAYISVHLTILVIAFMTLGYLYSAPPFALKRYTTCATAIGTLGGLCTYAAGFTVAGGDARDRLLVFALAMSAWMGLVGIQAKDLPDVAGDEVAGRRTIATRYRDWVVRLLIALAGVAVGTGFVVAARLGAPSLTLPAVAVLVGALALTVLLFSRYSRDGEGNRRRPYRVFMLTQYASHVCLLSTAFAA